MGHGKFQSCASSAKLDPFYGTNKIKALAPGLRGRDRRQPPPRLISAAAQAGSVRGAHRGRTGPLTPLGIVNNVEPRLPIT